MGVSGLLKDAEYLVRRRARPGVLCSCACSYLCGSGADQVMPGAFAPGTGCGRLQAPSGKKMTILKIFMEALDGVWAIPGAIFQLFFYVMEVYIWDTVKKFFLSLIR